MQGIVYDTSGPLQGELRLAELPEPEPADGEVRVSVMRSGVNPTDAKARRNPKSRSFPQQVPNQDGSGIIDRVGAGVDPNRIGQRVWVYHAAYLRPSGTAAEFCCVPQELAVPLPDTITFDHGAALGIPAMTAHRCLFTGDLGGRTVLVTGGAGAVGHAAIQLARWGGAGRVVATVSGREKAELAEAAGADAILNYRLDSYDRQLALAVTEGIDVVADVAVATNLPSYVEHLNLHADVSSYASGGSPLNVDVSALTRRNANMRFIHIYTVEQPDLNRATADITAALDEGALRPLPFNKFRLEDTDAAHTVCMQGALGKVVIDVSDG